MSIAVYEIKSPLSQVSTEQTGAFISALSAQLGESLERVNLDAFAADDFGLIYIASGGSEGLFKQMYGRVSHKPCYLLASDDSNSLAASMEILAYLQQGGHKGEILHGELPAVASRIRALSSAVQARARLDGLRLGVVGVPSDWLIASACDEAAYAQKLNARIVPIPMQELLDAMAEKPVHENEWTKRLRALGYPSEEMDKSLTVYAALRKLVARYRLGAVTVRCFDLLGTVFTTGCLALAILNAEGVAAGCEGDVPSTMSMAILNAVSGRPVFMCNPSRISEAGGLVLAHCTLPVDMPGRMELTTHYESGIGVAIAGAVPEGPCTVFKASGDLSRYFARAGVIECNLREPTLCRTQIRVRLSDYTYFTKQPIQNHHLVCTGDHVAALEEFFALLG